MPTVFSATLLSKDVNHLTMLCTSLAVSYLCRNKKCLFHGSNGDWIAHGTKAFSFRCPSCKTLYQPSAVKEGWCNASFCITWQTEEEDGTVSTSVAPATYPPSAEEKALNNLKELHARWKADGVQGVRDYKERKATDLQHLLGPFRQITLFRHQSWVEGEWLDEIAWPLKKRAHIVANGFRGNHMTPEQVTDDKVFKEWGSFLALIEEMAQTA